MPDPLLPGIYAPDSDAIYSANQPFATPEQIAQQRAYARALLDKSTEGPYVGKSGKFEAVSPWGVAGQLGQAAAGQFINYRQAQNERKMLTDYGRAQTAAPVPGLEQLPQGQGISQSGSPGSQGATATAYSGDGGTKGSWFGNFQGQNNWVDKSDSGLQASGLPTSVPGIALPNRGTLGQLFDVTTPDGRTFTVRQTDLGPAKWTGRGVDVNSALAEQMGYNPKNFPTDGRFTVKPHQGGASAQASPMQFAGPGASAPPDPVAQAMGGAGPAYNPTMSFSGQPQGGGGGAPNSQDAIVSALRGGQPAGPAYPSQAVPGRAPTPGPQQGGQGGMAGGFFPQRPQMTRQQAADIMSSPLSTPQDREYARAVFYGQGQPTSVQGQYGWTYVRDAQGNVAGIAPAPHWTEEGTGDIKTQTPQIVDPTGRLQTLSGGGGGAPLTPPPQGAGSNIPQTHGFDIGGGDNDIHAPPKAPGPRSEADPEGGKPTQVASLNTGTVTDASPPGPLGTKPPTAPPVQTAQAGVKSLNDMTIEERANYAQERALALSQGQKDLEKYNDEYQKHQQTGQTAKAMQPQLNLLGKLFQNPDLIQGPWSEAKQAINNSLQALTGNEKTTVAASLSGAVKKLVSSNILGQMREQLQGLGQVRLAEIALLAQSMASQENTPQANAAILYIAKKLTGMASDIGDITSDYASGARWDKDGKRTTDNATDRPTNVGQNAAINTYMKKHPSLNDSEIDDLENVLTNGKPMKSSFDVPKGYSRNKPGGQ